MDYAYRKQLSGATSYKIARYNCIPTLIKDKADTVIIYAGTNDQRKEEDEEIIDSIINIVNNCQKYEVTNICVVISNPNTVPK